MKGLTETIRAVHTRKEALGLVFVCLFVFVFDTNKQTEKCLPESKWLGATAYEPQCRRRTLVAPSEINMGNKQKGMAK